MIIGETEDTFIAYDSTSTPNIENWQQHPDLTSNLTFRNCIVPLGNYFDISNPSFGNIKVTGGKFFIQGYLIEFLEDVTMDLNEDNSYLLDEVADTTVDGIAYLLLYYPKTPLEHDAYIGFVRDINIFYDNIDNMLFLGIISYSVIDDVIVEVTDISRRHSTNDTLSRKYPPRFLDGGWLGQPKNIKKKPS